MNETIIDIAIYITYGLVGIALLGAIVFPLINVVTDFNKAKGALIGFAALAVVLLISWAVSSSEPYEAFNVGPATSQWIGGGIIATMVLIGLALFAAIFTEVFKYFR